MFLSKLSRTHAVLSPFAERQKVLLVEDEPSLKKQVAAHLTHVGFDVVAVADGDAALTALRDRKPHLVFLDLNLPRISGYEVCEQIRTDPEMRELLVLMTSERLNLEARAHSYEAGADSYLGKPYTLDELTREVRRLLDASPGSYGYR